MRLSQPADAEAWEEFCDTYLPVIFRIAKARGLQDADAHDVSQNVLVRVARSVKNWSPDQERGSFGGWLGTIARNLIIDFLRSHKNAHQTLGGSELNRLVDHTVDYQDVADFESLVDVQEPSPLERQIAFLKKARTDEQKETVKQRIRKELVRQYDTYLVASSDELKRLELRLVKLREKLIVREKAKEKMIDLELQRIVNEAEGLTWPKKMNQRRPVSGFGGMGGLGPVNWQPVKPRTTPRQELLGEIPPAKAETKPKPPPKTLSREEKEKEKTKNWLKQIGLAAHSYESQHKY